MGASRSVWEVVECKLETVNFWTVSEPRRAFRPAFGICGLSDDRYRSDSDLWYLVHEYKGSDCNKFGNTLERQREHWVHLGMSPKQCRNHKQTLRDAWVLIDIDSEDCRYYQRLSGCPRAIDFPQWELGCMDYCASSILNHTRYYVLQYSIYCLATLRNQKNGTWFKHTSRYTKTITRLSSQMISIKHVVNVIHYLSHLIRANESRNTQFIHGARQLEVLLVFGYCSYLPSGWNGNRMLFGSIGDI